jgi:hypothetical protein
MWLTYFGSYFVLGLATGETFNDTLISQLGNPLLSLIARANYSGLWSSNLPLIMYSTLPIIAVIIYGFMRQWSVIIRDISKHLRYGSSLDPQFQLLGRTKFSGDNEYKYFLANHFNGDDQLLSSFGLFAMEDCIMQRQFSGGSDAITALVEVDHKLLIRKFAVGLASERLQSQANWLKLHQDDNLPVVQLLGERQGASFYRYDMPLVMLSNDFYDVIHTSPIERCKSLLNLVIDHITTFHRNNKTDDAPKGVVDAYLIEKAVKNASTILGFTHELLSGQEYQINGKTYHLSDWDCLKDINWLTTQVHQLGTSIIHGDLTIENIIVTPEQKAGFYIIDPNPDNIFNTPLIDLAKLMQSLHLGYESLNRGGNFCSITEDAIELILTRSDAYSGLHTHFEQLIIQQYSIDTLKEVYFHELINYLRLTPYKIRKDPQKGLTFFACTSILLARYLEHQ